MTQSDPPEPHNNAGDAAAFEWLNKLNKTGKRTQLLQIIKVIRQCSQTTRADWKSWCDKNFTGTQGPDSKADADLRFFIHKWCNTQRQADLKPTVEDWTLNDWWAKASAASSAKDST